MAQLNSRGTLTRGRWDYFEHSNGIAFVWGSVATGQIGAYYANNSTGQTAVDIYTILWSASVNAAWTVQVLHPQLTLAALAPTEASIYSLQPDQATPPGVVGMFTASSGPFHSLNYYPAGNQGLQMSPIMGNYFLTLPPNWAIAVTAPNITNPCSLSMTIWFQYVTDNIAPAQ